MSKGSTIRFTVEREGARLVGEHSGEGGAIVFLHAGVADRRMWRPQMVAFRGSHHVVAYDRRGFGETRTDDEPFSHVGDLGNVLDQLGVTQASLVGCSQGGRIAIDFALAEPRRVTTLVLISPAVSGAPTPSTLAKEIEARLEALDRAEEADDLDRMNSIEAHLWLDGPLSPEGRVGGATRELFLDMNGIALAMPDLTHESEPPSAYERVAELSLATLVISGELDFPHVKARCRYLVDTIPGATGMEIPGTAHLPSLEKPEFVNELLREFLK